MTHKVLFLPGMGSRNGAHDVRVVATQFGRALRRWVEDKRGITVLNVWSRGFGPGRHNKTMCAAINVANTVSALNFLEDLREWVAEQSAVVMTSCRFGALSSDRLGDTLTAVFYITEGDGRVRLRPVRRGSRSRQPIAIRAAHHSLQPDQQEPAGAAMVV